MGQFTCGAAIRNITPSEDMFPMPRMEGVVDEIFLRAIAVGDGENKALFISYDLIGAPDPADQLSVLSEKTGIPVENIWYLSTHAHATPAIGKRGLPPRLGQAKPEERANMDRYTEVVFAKLYEAAEEAVNSMKPARFGYASGEGYINVRRNVMMTDPDGKPTGRYGLGNNGALPVDHTLFTMRIEDLAGCPIAFLINYPVHNVVMHENRCINGKMGVSADLGGVVSKMVEKKFPGSVAMWTSGAAGDVNPIVMNQHYVPDPENGGMGMVMEPDGNVAILTWLADIHFHDALLALNQIDHYETEADICSKVKLIETPGRDVRPSDPNNWQSDEIETIDENTAPYTVRMHLTKIGKLHLVGISGELYTTHAFNLKEKSPAKDMVIVTHDSNQLSCAGYIYDDDGIEHRALHYNRSKIRPGYIGPALEKTMLELMQ